MHPHGFARSSVHRPLRLSELRKDFQGQSVLNAPPLDTREELKLGLPFSSLDERACGDSPSRPLKDDPAFLLPWVKADLVRLCFVIGDRLEVKGVIVDPRIGNDGQETQSRRREVRRYYALVAEANHLSGLVSEIESSVCFRTKPELVQTDSGTTGR